MERVIVLDAGVLIGLLEPADLHHDAAVRLLLQASAPLWVHTLTLAEVLVGPARQGVEQRVRDDLLEVGLQVADLGSDEAPLLARVRCDHRLKMPDACVLATALHLQAPLATFDAKLSQAAQSVELLHAIA